MNRTYKRILLMLLDTAIIFIAGAFSYIFLDPLIVIPQVSFVTHLIMVVVIYLVLAYSLKIFDKINRYTGIKETLIHVGIVVAAFVFATALYYLLFFPISLRYVVLVTLGSATLIPSTRVVWRVWIERIHKNEALSEQDVERPQRTLLFGAGDGGAMFVKSLRDRIDIDVVGFIDDDPEKQGLTVYGYPVIGGTEDIKDIVTKYQVDQVTISTPSLDSDKLREVSELVQESGAKLNRMPYIEDVLLGKAELGDIKKVDVTDVLGREEVQLDMSQIAQQLTGDIVLVSGAGGSIGSEICRQVARFRPSKLVLLGHGELSIYSIEKELRSDPNNSFEIVPVIADIQDRDRMFQVMAEHRPQHVYHAAAHKHVPLMEANPYEAVKNNIYGTKNIAEAAKAYNVESFVMISTDKAVNPPNVMGSTKRVAEMIVTGLNEPGKTKFTAVRFGNVLNSSGSVIPVFEKQIEEGGPVTVTDFRMTRYFMTIPEASRLVLQAGSLADGGEIFILDMGEPVKILDLAKKMIWLSGHTENEIEIVESGIRPGEKLYEELLASDENTEEKVFDKIFIGKVNNLPLDQVMAFVESLKKMGKQELKKSLVDFANNRYDFQEN